LQIGWGTANLNALANSPTAPAFVLADRLWSGGSLIVLVALVNSGLGVCVACTTSSTRTLFGMARTGALPSLLARVSPKYRTPIVAVYVQIALAVATCLAVGLPMGPYNLFNLLGTTGTFAYIPIFILMTVAAFKFFRDKHRDEFSILQFVVCPIIASAALLIVGYKSIVPLPAMPVALAPVIAAVYILIGLAILFGRNLRPGKRGWMEQAGELPDVENVTA
jgi:amino acid transporter